MTGEPSQTGGEANEMFNDVKVGDKLVRMFRFLGHDIAYEAEVIEVTNTIIACLVILDIPRRLRFYRDTGISIYGSEYGWLTKEQTEC